MASYLGYVEPSSRELLLSCSSPVWVRTPDGVAHDSLELIPKAVASKDQVSYEEDGDDEEKATDSAASLGHDTLSMTTMDWGPFSRAQGRDPTLSPVSGKGYR